jgi:hypothetical protein
MIQQPGSRDGCAASPLQRPMTIQETRRKTPRPDSIDRRRSNWSEFRQAYPGILATMGIALLLMVAFDMWLLYNRNRYEVEIERLRGGMSDFEKEKADMILATDERRLSVMIELIRRQSRVDETLHLGVSLDSSVMYLERDGARLRAMPVRVGLEKTVGVPPDTVRMVVPRGVRTIERVIDGSTSWDVPAWVFTDRGIPVATQRSIAGALGPVAIVLNGGTVIYSPPTVGPLSEPEYVLPGSVRAKAEDLTAVAPNLQPGMKVYFY